MKTSSCHEYVTRNISDEFCQLQDLLVREISSSSMYENRMFD